MENYAKVVVKGSPISKSNFKLFNLQGRAILPNNSGKYHDRYAHYEEEIAFASRIQNPNVMLTESLIAVLKVYYKSFKRHPDTNNITKSIFDGIEKSGLIINDAQIRRLIIEEYYDKDNPRFELELFGESTFSMKYEIYRKDIKDEAIDYEPPSNKKNSLSRKKNESSVVPKETSEGIVLCSICSKEVSKASAVSANNGKMLICRNCLKNLF